MDDLMKLKKLQEEGFQMQATAQEQESLFSQAPLQEETQMLQDSVSMRKMMQEQGVGGIPEVKVKEGARLARMSYNMQTFADVFQREWGKPVDAGANALVRGASWLSKKLTGDKSTTYFSLNSFAYGTEVVGAEKDEYAEDEKRSDTAVDLMDSLSEWYRLSSDKNGMPDLSESIGKLYELAQTSNAYIYSHKKSKVYGVVGKGREKVAKKVRSMVNACLKSMVTEEERDEIYGPGNAQYEVGESPKVITKKLGKAAKAYDNYRKQIIKLSQGYTTGEEILEKKYNALRVYDREMRLYREKYPFPADRDPAINEMITEYEECLTWKTVFAATKHKEEGLSKIIENHMEEEGEIEGTSKYKTVPKDDTEELSPEQLKGINEIDQWLLRNFQNGGLAGLILSFVKNTDGEVVTNILAMSKRERLHIYYLVEKDRRRKANIADVGGSQNYTPTLDGFKDQILATRLKFWKRATGGYTYMNKLSDAYQVTMQYRKEINSVAEAEREEKKKDVNPLEEGSPEAAEATVVSKLVELKHALEAYRDDQEMLKNAKSKREKAGAQAVVDESKSYCLRLLNEVKELDGKREKVYMEQREAMETEVNEDLSKYSFVTKWPNWIDKKLFDVKLLNGAFEAGTDGAVALLGAVTSTITLFKTGAQLSNEERAERSLQILQSTYTAVQKGLSIASGFMEGAKGLAVAAEGMKDLAGVVGVVISGGVAISQAVSADKMDAYGKKAGDYFKQKRERLEKNKDGLSKKEKRELKYEKNMMKLQEGLSERQERKAIYSGVGAGLAVVGMIPGVGTVATVASTIVSIVGSIHDIIAVGKLQTTLFDNFFNLDALTDKVMAKRYKNHMNNAHNLAHSPRERVKEALRMRAAGYAGFSNMRAAALFVCSKFAGLIREKLFGGNTPPAEKEAYITFVQALNLRYNEEKGLPDEHILVRKMSAT